MKKIIIAVLVLIAAGVGYGVYFQGKTATDFVSDVTKNGNWSEERRQKDPEGYSVFVEKRLKDAIEKYETMRKQFGESSQKLQAEIADRQEKLAKSSALLEQMLAALDKGEFPVEVYGAKYDEEQLRSQIAVLMSEQESYEKAIEEGVKARKNVDKQAHDLITQITENENQLAMIEHNRKLFASRKLTAESKELIEDLAKAFDADVEFQPADPVGSLDVLIKRSDATNAAAAPDPDEERVNKALEEYRARMNAKASEASEEVAPETEGVDEKIVE